MSTILLALVIILGFLLFKCKKKLDSTSEKLESTSNRLEVAENDLERVKDVDAYCQKQSNLADSLSKTCKALSAERKILELENLVGFVNVDEYSGLKSDEVKNQLTMLRGEQDKLVKSDRALDIKDIGLKKSELNSQKKQILRCFNAECKSLIEGVTVKNVDNVRAKIQRSYDAINKIFSVDGVQISSEYLALKYKELSMIYAYMVKEDEEREQRKAIREQMLEEEKVRREIEQAKKKIEKEETQFKNEVNKLMAYLQNAKDEVERKLYVDKISEIQSKLASIEADKENVLQREQNTRAGFVYIISNIGAFGENVYKIGMTRRLDPLDRISELSSASVPFPFDVHAMIFSDDAPGLETILHQYFDVNRVNKVNPRKEFFRVDLEDIKRVVLENHNATVKFIDIPDALEYRETIKMEAVKA